MSLSRRQFCEWLGSSGLLAASLPSVRADLPLFQEPSTAAQTGSHIGTLYPFVQTQADRSRFELSFLQDKFRALEPWQKTARAKVLEHLFYAPPPVAPMPEVVRRDDRGDYVQEYLTFQTTPDLRVPAYVLIPKRATLPAPGIVLLHCHGGFYAWGKEKVVEVEGEPSVLTEFKQQLYGGKSIATELVRRGYVVITIDMFYWGERRMLLDDDPPSYRDPRTMTKDDIAAFNRRSQQGEQLVARSLLAAGITWPGVMLWDDLRTLDYLATRPEVDRDAARLRRAVRGWLSQLPAGGPRSAHQGGHRCGVDVVLRRAHQAARRQLDRPDVPHRRAVPLSGSARPRGPDCPTLGAGHQRVEDQLFPPEGVEAAFKKIEQCFRKAGVPERQRCRLYDAPHQFNVQMQADAWEWLERSHGGWNFARRTAAGVQRPRLPSVSRGN